MTKQEFFIKALAFYSFTLGLLMSCQGISEVVVPQYLEEKKIPSLLEVYPDMQAKVTEWDADAKLSIINIDLNSRRNDVIAIYTSPNDLAKGFLVRYRMNGIVTTEVIEYNFPRTETREKHFIDISEIGIDSVNAWSIFMKHSEVLAYKQKFFECAELILLPSTFEESERIIWRLSIGECDANKHDYFHIDAKTGEWLDIDFP